MAEGRGWDLGGFHSLLVPYPVEAGPVEDLYDGHYNVL